MLQYSQQNIYSDKKDLTYGEVSNSMIYSFYNLVLNNLLGLFKQEQKYIYIIKQNLKS
jgi:hypothetical protein